MTQASTAAPACLQKDYVKGGSFLLDAARPEDVFTPEDFTPDQLLYAKTARQFMEAEVIPVSDAIEAKDLELSRRLIRMAGELGLLMGDVPEAYGGLGLDKPSCALIAESVSGQGSFQTMAMAHTGIGTLPIVYYGTEAHKQKYLPGLADGSLIGAYALTEPSSGSDALSARTKAVLSADGSHFVLNGTKQFITNAGFADVFTVFAKIDGDKFTGFVVERGTPGLKIGPEEHKLGIRGSTTTTVILEDALVPAENVLGEIGKGHKIAFNILNIGRFKLGMGAVGGAKRALEAALAYTLERKQFGRRLADFGAIREKLAEMYVRIYAAESMAYRTAGLIEQLLGANADRYEEAGLQAIEEYSIECAMVKVHCSEALDFVVDETVQCLGGYGFCAEYPAERYYRDSRINRIYEGTNEVNRLLVPTMLLRKAASGELELAGSAPEASGGHLAAEQHIVANLKRIALSVLCFAGAKYGKAIAGEQAILLRLADLVTLAFTAESALLRARKEVDRRGEAGAALPVAAARAACEAAIDRAESLARRCLVAMGAEDGLAELCRLTARRPADVLAVQAGIAAKLVELERVVL
ncbi:MAG: acyl-CoA dehydrogenase family protein [Deltaproteobacteria bacterium]|nr:acyl-CoA dehydrogenase family protein [Deltaproteobacteria bacterium]